VPQGKVFAIAPVAVLKHAVVGPGLGRSSHAIIPDQWRGSMLGPEGVVEVEGILEIRGQVTAAAVSPFGGLAIMYMLIASTFN